MGLRFGLLGTGHWAAEVHGAALSAHPDATLTGVWGRDHAKAKTLAKRYATEAYEDVDALLADVDAVAIALPPDVQAELALRAARAGKHLLLDKPVALSTSVADQLLVEVESRELASVVFFTHRFSDGVEEFVKETEQETWHGVQATLFASIFRPDNPFGASPWRREKGGLWDVGPHVLSVVLPVLGPVLEVTALSGPRSTTHVLTRHTSGAVGTYAVTLDAPEEAQNFSVSLHGDRGWVPVPDGDRGPVEAFGAAIDRLLSQVEGEVGDPCDVRFGRDVVATLEAAERSLWSGQVERVSEAPGALPRA